MNDQTPNQASRSQQPPPQPDTTQTEASPKKYRKYEDVPWSRRSGANTAFILTSVFTCGLIPLTLWTCINLMTGDVYYNQKDTDGYLKTWSFANKVAAVLIVIFNVIYLLVTLANLGSKSR